MAADDTTLDKPLKSRIWRTFDNPWSTWTGTPSSKPIGLFKYLVTDTDNSNIPPAEELDKTLPVKKPNMNDFEKSPENGIRTMWIGHASVLVQFDGLTILTDPMFSKWCGPPLIFPSRYRPPPCSIAELPHLDAVVISHNHYDHLDESSVRDLNLKYGNKLTWYVPLELKKWMKSMGCEKVVELSWWDEHSHPDSSFKFVCLPCQHWSKRGAFDTNWTLWCSWAILGPKHRFYFGGDTGYCPVFKKIGQKYGRFSLAALPIGAYEPNDYMKAQHVNPEEAVQIHLDIQADRSLGIHWGTFKLTYEPYLEPKQKIAEIVKNQGLKPNSFFTLNHGEVEVIGNVDSAPQPNIESTPQPIMASTPQPDTKSAPQANIESTPQPIMASTPQPNMASTPQPIMASTPQPDTKSAPQPNMASTAQPIMLSTPQPIMSSTPQPNMVSTPQPNMASTPQPNIEPTPQPNMEYGADTSNPF